jgi:hypothetical protein
MRPTASLTPKLTPWRMDAGRKWWTPMDKNIRNLVHRRTLRSSDFRLPTVRNRQVIGSSPIAGSSFTRSFLTHG